MLRHAQGLQLGHHDALKNQLSIVDVAISEINPKKDQELFIEHNLRPFGCPADWIFEPCSSHYDTVRERWVSLCDYGDERKLLQAELNVDGGAKIFLQNKLARSRAKLLELNPLLVARSKCTELSTAKRLTIHPPFSPHPLISGDVGKEAEQAMSFVDAGSGNPSSGSVDAIDVRHRSPRNNPRIHMTARRLFFFDRVY